jgi:hypothetical protein
MNITSLQSNFKAENNSANALFQRPCQEECTHCHKVEARQTSSKYELLQLRSWRSENSTTEWPGQRSHSGGSRDWTAPRMERHRRPHPHVQKVLVPMEMPRCEEWNTKAPPGIRLGAIKYSPDSSSSEQSERRADRRTWWILRRSLWCQQDSE